MNASPNQLINESSPYLKQHAFNPVNWHAWNDETLAKALRENKLMILSIGYSTCHWCHVMEHDSFENEEVAALMNDFFIPVKIDREERPDLDSVYMQAVQMMTGKGGWPLNCITLPDGKPLYGGTFFPRKQWINVLKQVRDLWHYEPERCRQYANELLNGLRKTELFKWPEEIMDGSTIISDMVKQFENSFDSVHGGFSRVPKFPMPGNIMFLLRYAYHTNNQKIKDHVILTLDRMASGGIYDHLAGGFARYSTDAEWKIPHFEKMLYDNAQLISLYASAFAFTGFRKYREVVTETMQFVINELMSSGFGFYSALDADTEGEEGKFYIWQKEEIDELLGVDAPLFCKAYGINEKGFWEHGKYVLVKNDDLKSLSGEFGISEVELEGKMKDLKSKLFHHRKKRVNPGVDNKFILSWNALMLSACCDAYRYLNKKEYLDLAVNNYHFIRNHLMTNEGTLLHSTHPDEISGKLRKNSIEAFADDYASFALACISLFSVTAEEDYLNQAIEICRLAAERFTDPDTGLLFYTSAFSKQLILRRTETEDNVLPSANSMYAHLLFLLGRITGNTGWEEQSLQMCHYVQNYMISYPSAFSNWGLLLMNHVYPFFELILTGKNALEKSIPVWSSYQPDVLFCVSKSESQIGIFKNRFNPDKTRFFLCSGKSCLQPVETYEEVLNQIKSVRKSS
jgi:uncharacterized protein YyaL (SSP411 family)